MVKIRKIIMNKKLSEKYIQPVSMKIIVYGKKYVANTWVHKLPITEWLYRKIFYLGRYIGETTIDFRGMALTLNTKDISMVPALINNNFEEYELEIFGKLIKSGTTILDVGGNIGIYSLIASKKTGSNGHVYAFEPVPENIDLLSKNLKQNNITNVTLIKKAVGDFDGLVQMEIEEDSLATHHVSKNPKNSASVKVTTIDSFVKLKKIKKIELVKMDIEGYEGYAIEGASETLKQKSLKLLTEFSADFINRSGKDPLEVAKALLDTFKYCYHVNEKGKELTATRSVNDLLDYRKTNFLLSHSPVTIK